VQQVNPLLSTHNYTPLVISGKDKNKQAANIIKPIQARIYRKKYVDGSVISDGHIKKKQALIEA
jgi:hypothetical protein